MPQFRKLGRIFDPAAHASNIPYTSSAAILPLAQHISESRYRVVFSGRDTQGRSQIGAFTLDLQKSRQMQYQAQEVMPQPLLGLGSLGAFDDNGVTATSIVEHAGITYLYYGGWTLGVTVPFYAFVGCAVSTDGLHFTRVSRAPILDRSSVDPYLTLSPTVLIENGIWRMWYISGTDWVQYAGAPRHYYHIKYAESHDGIVWDRRGIVCIDYKDDSEYALARPIVQKTGDQYEMWFSHRGDSYRLGYATSRDGIAWTRDDSQAGLDVSVTGWDSEMVCYADLFVHNGNRYMLYNGNGYGRSGIGLAVED